MRTENQHDDYLQDKTKEDSLEGWGGGGICPMLTHNHKSDKDRQVIEPRFPEREDDA
jgi:hypothetical protein